MNRIVQVFAGTPEADAYKQWWLKARNDVTVDSYMQTEPYTTFTDVTNTDWERGVWMCGDSVLSAMFNRPRRSASLTLYSLDTFTRIYTVAQLIRFVKSTLIIKYGLDYIDFCIAESNAVWLSKIDSRLRHFKFGIHPNALFNGLSGEYEDMHMYQIPTSVLHTDGRRCVNLRNVR
jgi:hypothetical protein